ncbi:acyl carrier protein, partial [Rhizomonospora bruguierae]|uniref:acyl carrier protein n=1 Tax=Rhizomonospora bruguierae TaxID=1581705 RepID=UPI001BCF3E19
RPVTVPIGLDTRALARSGDVPPILSGLIAGHVRARRAAVAPGAEFAARLAGLDAAGRLALILGVVRLHAARVLGHDSIDAVPAGRVFSELGFDSLSAVEFRNQLGAATGVRLPATLVFDYPTPEALARFVFDELKDSGPSPVPAATATVVAGNDPIVIVGMGCRFPGGVSSPDELWHLLGSGVDAMGG